MLDFLSTRNVDHQTAACARLLASVIAQAIKDAATPFGQYEKNGKMIYEKKLRQNLNRTAGSAIRFLFFDGSVFPLYATLIGADAQAIRMALKNRHTPDNKLFTQKDRQIILARLVFERHSTHNGAEEDESFEGDDLP